MKRVLLTGMSAVGKPTVAERLSELGYKAVDTDYGGDSVVDERGDQHWDVDHIVLLSAPRDVMVERLATRTNNPFGKSSDGLAKILANLETYEPMNGELRPSRSTRASPSTVSSMRSSP